MVALIVAQLGCQVVSERRRGQARQTALETAANVLEAARACPYDELTAIWGASQRLPESATRALPGGRLVVRVEPEPSRPYTRRVTVEVHWLYDNDRPAPPVQLVALRSARAAAGGGGSP
jgi:hypothetical protein